MPGPIYHVGNTAVCPHGGQAQDVPSTPRVTVMGQPIGLMPDQYLIAGCAFNIGGAPHPCVRIQWLQPATRVTSMGKPVMMQTSTGLCQAPDQAPQGAPIVAANQTRVVAT
jgi:hypothetical protein